MTAVILFGCFEKVCLHRVAFGPCGIKIGAEAISCIFVWGGRCCFNAVMQCGKFRKKSAIGEKEVLI